MLPDSFAKCQVAFCNVFIGYDDVGILFAHHSAAIIPNKVLQIV